MKMFRAAVAAVSVCSWLAFSPAAGALSTNLTPVADTTLRSSVPDVNLGGDSALLVGVSAIEPFIINRALLKFDLAALPPDATVTGATLTLKVTRTSQAPASYELHRVLRAWEEMQATWNSCLSGLAWNQAGGEAGTDYAPAATASAILAGAGSSGALNSATLLSDVLLWMTNASANFGWMLRASGEPSGTGRQLGSRENLGNEPVLTIEFSVPEPPPLPAQPTIFDTALVGNAIRFSFQAESNRTYGVEFRNSLTAGDWGPLTNIPALPEAVVHHLTNSLSPPEGYFRIRTP